MTPPAPPESTIGAMTTAVRPHARPASEQSRPADVFVVFGITGDLAKQMTFRSLYRLGRRGLPPGRCCAGPADAWPPDALRERAHAAIAGAGETIDTELFDRFMKRF